MKDNDTLTMSKSSGKPALLGTFPAKYGPVFAQIARRNRLARVYRYGQAGRRGWVLKPLNRAEQFKQRVPIKGR